MRNENLELAQSSGSESSPSWGGSATPKASTFNFEFQAQSQTTREPPTKTASGTKTGTVDDLSTQFKVALKTSKSNDDIIGSALKDDSNDKDISGGDVSTGSIRDEGGGDKETITQGTSKDDKCNPTFRSSSPKGNKCALFPALSATQSSQKSKSFNYEYGGGGDYESSSSTGGNAGSGGESSSKILGKESKIARFLRRTQSANEDSSASMMMKSVVGDSSKAEVEGAQHHHHHHHHHQSHHHGSAHTSREHHHSQPQSSSQQHQHLQKIGDDTTTSGGGGVGAEEGRGCSAAAAARSKRHKFASVGTDMKFRLGFLKRRHTEGTIHSASVRPPPEEAQKWANSFTDLMASKYGQALFKAFLQREFSEENIEFWLAIEDYRKSRQNKLNTKAQKIYNDFIIPQAPKEVNLDALTKDSLVTKMAQPTHSTFDQAQKRIQGLLEADAYSRFLKSDLYMELVHPEKYQQQASP